MLRMGALCHAGEASRDKVLKKKGIYKKKEIYILERGEGYGKKKIQIICSTFDGGFYDDFCFFSTGERLCG